MPVSAAHAACGGGSLGACSNPGAVDWDGTNAVYKFCNGTDWISMAGDTTAGACSSTGALEYDSGLGNYKFCDGTNWIPVGNNGTLGACSGVADREYDTGNSVMKWCNGSNWIDMTGGDNDPCCEPTVTVGTICADGSVYAGLTPDGNVKMFAARCDYDGLWSGSSCGGANVLLAWNNGNASNKTLTGANSLTDGDGNTATLIVTDSDSGTPGIQPHQAAQACADATTHGRNDWYLPARDELTVLYQNSAAIGNFITVPSIDYYWSSTEASQGNARYKHMGSGSNNTHDKKGGNFGWPYFYIRCVRHE